MRRLVHAFKYAGGHQLLEPLGRRMALDPRVSAWCQSRPASLVVPVPLQRVARRRRGYNQAALLAAGLARGAGLEHEAGALRRRRAGAPQAGAEVCERRRRARAAYAACPARVGGRRILLVDDVLSTGATADACSRALRLAGAVEVTVAVLAT